MGKGLFRRDHESSFTAYLILLTRLTFHHWTVLLSPDHEKIKACNVQLVSLTQGKGPNTASLSAFTDLGQLGPGPNLPQKQL